MTTIRFLLVLLCLLKCIAFAAAGDTDREAMEKTMKGLGEAFAKGDVEAIASYHHPRVEKALSPTKYVKGRDAVVAELRGTFSAYRLEFVEHNIESLEFFGDTCVEISRFAVRGEPKGDSPAFVFRGRAMVVYVRHAESPSGWASIRELIQPAGE